MEHILLYPIHRKSLIGFRMVNLQLTLSHSEGRSQGHANFDCAYLTNGDRLNWTSIAIASTIAFDWYIYIWHCPILNVSRSRSFAIRLRKFNKTESSWISLYVSVYAALCFLRSNLFVASMFHLRIYFLSFLSTFYFPIKILTRFNCLLLCQLL